VIWEDNQSAIAISRNPVQRRRTKHIDLRHHYVRDLVESAAVSLQYCCSAEMIADLLTKPSARVVFQKLVDYLLGPLKNLNELFPQTRSNWGGAGCVPIRPTLRSFGLRGCAEE
jgi:hypothetical protein